MNRLNGTMVFKITIKILTDKLNGVSDKWNGGSSGCIKRTVKILTDKFNGV